MVKPTDAVARFFAALGAAAITVTAILVPIAMLIGVVRLIVWLLGF